MANDDLSAATARAKAVRTLVEQHRVEIAHARAVLNDLIEQKAEAELEVLKVTSGIARLPASESGWQWWLVFIIFPLGAFLEWNIAHLIAQTVFGLSERDLLVFTVVLAICGVATGWFIGRLMRPHRVTEVEPAGTVRVFVRIALIVAGVLMVAAFLLRVQYAREENQAITLTALLGQALITTVLSALGILVAAGFEFFRQGDEDLNLRSKRAAAERARAAVVRRIAHATSELRRAERAYNLILVQVGVSPEHGREEAPSAGEASGPERNGDPRTSGYRVTYGGDEVSKPS